jgi:kynurenine 3-monooxygenase
MINLSSNNNTTPNNDNVRQVMIAGAGPAGLLLTALLLKRNTQDGNEDAIKYKVTLLESRPDLGQLDPETELKEYRSWMIALAGHGLEAVRSIPELYCDYISNLGVRIEQVSIFLGAKELKMSQGDERNEQEAFIIDRNFVVAGIARYLKDKYSDSPYLECHYETQLKYVDYENYQVLIRSKLGKEDYMKYDLLVGCDGVRSTVREALVKRHSDFELDVGDIFQNFKAVHVTRPKTLGANSMSILPTIFPHMQGIALPETDGQVNISVGCPRNKFDEMPPELRSSDPKVVAAYVKTSLKAMELDDYDDFAKKWVNCRWNRTGQIHCNRYHSEACKIVIMGDAAHATSPSIGMGMNTALRDAQKFNELLDKYDDNLEQVLPQFSQDRVKEGNALSDLASHLYCLDTKQQLKETIHLVVRGTLSKWFPSLVDDHPQAVIGNPEWTLSRVYQLATDQGIVQKHRQINQRIRQEHFEYETGMLTRKPSSSFALYYYALGVIGVGTAAYHFLGRN